MKSGSNRNKLFLPLIDKAGCLPKLPPPTDEEFYVRKPAEEEFRGCCNDALLHTVTPYARNDAELTDRGADRVFGFLRKTEQVFQTVPSGGDVSALSEDIPGQQL